MRFLVSTSRGGSLSREVDCDPGLIVIPAFPIGDANHFISIQSSGISAYAAVDENNTDPDMLLKELVKQYPGMPEQYLEDILVDTLVIAADLDSNKIFRVFVDDHSATLQNVDDDSELIPIWKDRVTKNYL